MIGNAKTTNTFKNTAVKMLQNPKLISAVSDAMKSTKPVVVTERQDVKPLEEMKATDCGVLSSNIAKTQDTEKYERIYENLDDKSKEKFDSLPPEEKVMIAKIFENLNSDDCISTPDDLSFNENFSEPQNENNTILNNLIEIFQNVAYSDLKKYYRNNYFRNNYYRNNVNNKLKCRNILIKYQLCDIKNYLSKTNISVEDFFEKDKNFDSIMLGIKNFNFENEEIKNQVKENLYELANNENLKTKKRSLSEQDIASIIKFLTDKNKIMGKMEILKQLNLFDSDDNSCSDYSVENKLKVFNTFVEMIPENESFLDYKDEIIECVNNFIILYNSNIKCFLQYVNNTTIKEKETLLDRIIKCPYNPTMMFSTYCKVIFGNKYRDTSISILKLILQEYRIDIKRFDKLYDKYLPMLQQADGETLSTIKFYMLEKLFKLYEFFKKIQVNDENLLLENLPFQQLKELQTLLIQNNFNNALNKIDISFLNKNIDKIFIKKDDKIDFESTLFKVNKLLSVKHLDLPQTQKDNINNILNIKDDLANIDFEKIEIEILGTNNFEILKSKVNHILENDNSIGDNDKKIILAKFTNDIDSLMFNKLPQDLNQCEVVKKIREKVSEYFTFSKVPNEENTYTIGNVKISGVDDKTKSTLEFIFKAIPELVVLLGVNQGYRFDIGKHILAVGKEVVKNNKFQNLSPNNQKLVLIAALMHDIAKINGGHDVSHPQRGSQYAYNMLSGALSDDDKATVANLIFNHHFGEAIAKAENNTQKRYALAYECKDKNPEFLNMLEILGEADLLGDDENYKIGTAGYLKQIHGRIETLKMEIKNVDDILAELKDTLELTPFPQKTLASTEDSQTAMQECKKLGIVGEFKSGDITVDKIDLAKMKGLSPYEQKKYLSLLGFNTSYNKLEFLIHAISSANKVGGIDYLTSQFKSDATLSCSVITMANTTMYAQAEIGFIMEPDKTKVLSAAPHNIRSGFFKGRNQSGEFIQEYEEKKYYDALSKYIQNSRLKAQGEHSEAITIDNEVAAIFVKEGCEYKMPKELVEFAYKRHLPLIVVPRS